MFDDLFGSNNKNYRNRCINEEDATDKINEINGLLTAIINNPNVNPYKISEINKKGERLKSDIGYALLTDEKDSTCDIRRYQIKNGLQYLRDVLSSVRGVK